MEFVAGRPNFDIKDRAQYERTKSEKNCATCGDKLVPYSQPPFLMDAGYGFTWTVTDKSGYCEKCFLALKARREVRESAYKSVPYKTTATYQGKGGDGKQKDYEIIEFDGFAKVW